MAEKIPRRTPAELDSQQFQKGSRALMEEMNNTARAMRQVVKAEEQLAKATAAVAKSAKGALASFDQLDVLVQKKASGAAASSEEELTNAEKFPDMDKGRGGQAGEQHIPQPVMDAPGFADDLDEMQNAFDLFAREMGETWQEKLDNLLISWATTQALLAGNIGQMIPAIATIISEGWEDVVSPVLEEISSVLQNLWAEQIVPNFSSLMTYLSELIEQAPPILKQFIMPIADGFTTILLPNATSAVSTVGNVVENMGNIISAVTEGIIDTFSGMANFLDQVFIGNWSQAWQSIQEIFVGQWKTMKNFAHETVNGVIALVNAMISAATNGINFLIKQMNRIHFDVPDWVPYVGGKSFGVHIDLLEPYQIPMLATGAVIPPGAEFLAVLGDQKNGRNLEAPEGLIRQIVREESSQGQMQLNISTKGSAGELVRWLRFEMEREDRRQGQSLVKGGNSLALY